MTIAPAIQPFSLGERPTAEVEIVIPVFNEEGTLETSVRALRRYLDLTFPFATLITVADNASTDGTASIGARLARSLEGVAFVHLDQKGRGRALRAVWSTSTADVVAYMDVDLSTGLEALLPLVAPLVSGHSDVAIGTRLAPGSRVVRGPKREVISRIYNLLLRTMLGGGFSDAQCGFKALRRDAAALLLPLVQDNEWFFDTELLVLAERNGLRIHEVPVDWVDDPDSRVHIVATALDDLKGVARLLAEFARGEGRVASESTGRPSLALSRFAKVGLASTLAYLAIFALSWPLVGPFGANLASLVICTLANTAFHARVSFQGSLSPREVWAFGASVFVTNLALTSAALGVAAALLPATLLVGLLAVVAGAAAAAPVRLVLLRAWLFRHRAATNAVGPQRRRPLVVS
jgi:putative flippase GtrA